MANLIFREECCGGLIYDLHTWRLTWLPLPEAEETLSARRDDAVVHRRPAPGYLSAPLKVFMGICPHCNLACRHCVAAERRNQSDEITLQEVESILEQLGAIGVLEVRLSGGEPTQRDDLPDIVSLAKGHNLSVSLNSNGVFSQRTGLQLARSGVDRVHISLDGMEQNNDRIRGNGVFRACTRTIACLREHGVYVRIVVCLDKENLADIDPLIGLAEELDADIKFSPIAAVGDGALMPGLLDAADCLELQRRFATLRSRRNVFFNFGTMMDGFATYCQLDDFDSTVCGSGRTQLRVELSGDIYGAGCGDAEKGKQPLGTKLDPIEHLWHKAQREMLHQLERQGGACPSCDLSRVFNAWLTVPSPSFNFLRGPQACRVEAK